MTLELEYDFSIQGAPSVFVRNSCFHCKKDNQIRISRSDYNRRMRGDFAQDIWPNLSIDDRELIISGTHPECWQAIFGKDEDKEIGVS